MGLLSCFGIGPAQRPRVAPSTSMHKESRQLSLPLEVPQDDGKEEPYAQTVESYGPANSVSKSFKAGFLGSNFNNEFSLTNGEGWKVWQRPGEFTPEAVAQFGGQRMDSSERGAASPSLSDASLRAGSESNAGPDPSLQGDGNKVAFALPCSQEWGQEEVRGESVQNSSTSQSGSQSKDGVERRSESLPGLSREAELETLGGAALVAKLGTPYTIPLTPEIEEELQRSKLRNPSLLSRELSLTSSAEAEAAGFASKTSAAAISTPSTHRSMYKDAPKDAASNSHQSGEHKPASSPGLTKLRNGSESGPTLEPTVPPRRTQPLRSAGSMKQVKETHQIKEGEVSGRPSYHCPFECGAWLVSHTETAAFEICASGREVKVRDAVFKVLPLFVLVHVFSCS